MRRRIEQKRRVVLTLVEWLRNIADTAACPIGRRIKLFLYRVTYVQRAWRRAALVYHAQLQVPLMHICICHVYMSPMHTPMHTPMHMPMHMMSMPSRMHMLHATLHTPRSRWSSRSGAPATSGG